MTLELDGILDDDERRHRTLVGENRSVVVGMYPIGCLESNTDYVESNDGLCSLERNLNNLLEIHWNELEMYWEL